MIAIVDLKTDQVEEIINLQVICKREVNITEN